jgi:hypothetical protein
MSAVRLSLQSAQATHAFQNLLGLETERKPTLCKEIERYVLGFAETTE